MTEIVQLPGTALMYGPSKMREDHWDWSGINPPVTSFLLKTEDGEDAAILRIFLRLLRSETRGFRVAGIGGVWTRPDLRKQGWASELLLKTLQKIRVEQPTADLAVLHSKPRLLYEQHGFFEIADGLLAVPVHGDVTISRDREWYIEPKGRF